MVEHDRRDDDVDMARYWWTLLGCVIVLAAIGGLMYGVAWLSYALS